MSGINPVQGPTPPISLPPAAGASKQGAAAPKGDFGQAFLSYINQVDGHQQESGVAIQELLTGKNQDILSTVAAVAKADLSFKLLLGIRNKVIEAYKQTINMQI